MPHTNQSVPPNVTTSIYQSAPDGAQNPSISSDRVENQITMDLDDLTARFEALKKRSSQQ